MAARRWRGAAWSLLWLAVCCGNPARGQPQTSKAAQWVKADALIYLELTRADDLFDRAGEERVQGIVDQLPNVKSYLKSDKYREGRAAIDGLAKALDTTPIQLLHDLFGGGAVLAVEAERGRAPMPFLYITPHDPSVLERVNKKVLEFHRTKAEQEGGQNPIREKTHRGITEYLAGDHFGYALADGCFIAAPGADALEILIDRVVQPSTVGKSIADEPLWKARRANVDRDALAWALARIDMLRQVDPKRFQVPEQVNPLATILFGHWVESLRKAPWACASLTWTAGRLGADLDVGTPEGGLSDTYKRFVPPDGKRASALLQPPGTILSVGLWHDLSALWEVRTDLFPPEAAQGLAKLDSFAGQFFGGKDFGADVLGAFATDWNLVVALQDYEAMNPKPQAKFPAFALVARLKPDNDEFAQRLKVAFQSFVGLVNLGNVEKKNNVPPLELGTEQCGDVTIATARFMVPKAGAAGEGVHPRNNFSPSMAVVNDRFIVSASVGLTRDLIASIKGNGKPFDATLAAEASGARMAEFTELNRTMFVTNGMVKRGNDKETAEQEVAALCKLYRYLGRTTLSVKDAPDAVRLRLSSDIGAK
jgi:hypothetical protein